VLSEGMWARTPANRSRCDRQKFCMHILFLARAICPAYHILDTSVVEEYKAIFFYLASVKVTKPENLSVSMLIVYAIKSFTRFLSTYALCSCQKRSVILREGCEFRVFEISFAIIIKLPLVTCFTRFIINLWSVSLCFLSTWQPPPPPHRSSKCS
jgi:hypothetical protein